MTDEYGEQSVRQSRWVGGLRQKSQRRSQGIGELQTVDDAGVRGMTLSLGFDRIDCK